MLRVHFLIETGSFICRASSDRLFREALELTAVLKGWYFRGYALWGIGKNLMIQEHHQEAMPWLEDSLKIFEDAGAGPRSSTLRPNRSSKGSRRTIAPAQHEWILPRGAFGSFAFFALESFFS
jgi:hypothetical protein